MTSEEVLLEKFKVLPTNRKQELLDFAKFLESKEIAKEPRQSLEGIWADLDVNVSEEVIREVRQEM